MPKSKVEKPSFDPDLPFEDALEQLELLVKEMESDKISLEDLMVKYELGTQLHQVCEKRLDEAQGRIEIIRQQKDGSLAVEPFGNAPATESTSVTNEEDGSDNESKDGQLF